MNQELHIDLLGWSRGAVIAATVARNLQSPGVTFRGKTFKNVDVRFVGLFDAVQQMEGDWATEFSTNVNASYHLIHTYHGVSLDYPPLDEDTVFPTVTTLAPITEYFRPNPISGEQTQEASHSQVGTDPKSRDMMVTAARNAGVKIP